MSERVQNGAMRTTKAEELLAIGSGMQQSGMAVANCHVPSRMHGNVAVPIVGTGDRTQYDAIPFGIKIISDLAAKESLVSLIPTQPDHLVGLHVYDPDHKGDQVVSDEVESRAGYVALHALVSVGSREDWSDVELFGEEPGTGDLQPLPFEQGTANAMTYMGILRATANNKLQAHQADVATQQN